MFEMMTRAEVCRSKFWRGDQVPGIYSDMAIDRRNMAVSILIDSSQLVEKIVVGLSRFGESKLYEE